MNRCVVTIMLVACSFAIAELCDAAPSSGAWRTVPVPDNLASLDNREFWDEFNRGLCDGYSNGYIQGQTRGNTEGNASGQRDGYDTGWQRTYQPAFEVSYDLAFEESFNRSLADAFVGSFMTGFDAAARDQAGVTFSSVNFFVDSAGVFDVTNWMSLYPPNPANHTITYSKGYYFGFATGDRDGYDFGYSAAYDQAYDTALPVGSREGAAKGTADGETKGNADGKQPGAEQGNSTGYSEGYAYFSAGGARDTISVAAEERLKVLFGIQLTRINAALSQAVVAPGELHAINAQILSPLPEPSTSMVLFAVAAMGLDVMRRRIR